MKRAMYYTIHFLLILAMVVILFVMSVAYVTYLREYGGVKRLEIQLEEKQLEYNVLESEYESCVDYLRSKGHRIE